MNLLVIVQQSAHSLRTCKGIGANTQVALLSDLHRVKSWVATLLEHVEHLLHTAVHNKPSITRNAIKPNQYFLPATTTNTGYSLAQDVQEIFASYLECVFYVIH